MRSSSGVKEKIEQMPNGADARAGYDAFLEKFGLKKEKWRGISRYRQTKDRGAMRQAIHAGCGPIHLRSSLIEWVNVDIEPSHNADLTADYTDLSEYFPDESVALVATVHSLEHLSPFPDGLQKALKEFHRVLKPGGVIRIVVPDLMKVARKYVAGEDLKDIYDGPFHEGPDFPATRMQFFCRAWQHTVLFDEQLLRHFIEEAGFRNFRVMPFGVSEVPELCGIDRFMSESIVCQTYKL
jgi:predicted SAM-dependent methyltransferase